MKFSLFWSKLLSASNHRSIHSSFKLKTRLGILPFHELLLTTRCFSSQQYKEAFTVSYLIHNCGLPPNAARSAVKYVLFDNTEKPDSVLRLLRDLGLTDHTHISQAVRKHPRILLSNVNKTILPKLKFLRSIGFSTHDLQKSFCQSPKLFGVSLKRTIVPCYDILKKGLLLSDEQVVTALKRLATRCLSRVQNINVNISVLRGIGMHQSVICTCVCSRPLLFCSDVDKFSRGVKEVVEMGFDPMQYTFAAAVMVKLQLSSAWKCKIEAFAKWGLSEDEICLAFRKFPNCMVLSAESISDKMEFLVNKMGMQPAAVLKSPTILSYGLEKRIVPRCSVIGVLFLKGFIKHKTKLYTILKHTDDRFLNIYVMEHKKQVPDLLDLVQGKKGMEELGFELGEIRGALFT